MKKSRFAEAQIIGVLRAIHRAAAHRVRMHWAGAMMGKSCRSGRTLLYAIDQARKIFAYSASFLLDHLTRAPAPPQPAS